MTEFHAAYGIPIHYGSPTLDYERVHLRRAFIAEGFCELVTAVYGEQAGRVVGDAVTRAVAVDTGDRDVVGADGRPVLRGDGKVAKGPNYVRPDIARILRG